MFTLLRRSQGLGVALVVLAMTATVAFAAAGTPGGNSGLHRDQTTADSSEAPESEAPDGSEAPDASQAPEDSEAPDASQAPDSQLPDASQGTHGALVSTAANMDTPDGFANHGAFVSCVAHLPQSVDPTTFDWSTVTPEFCAAGTGQDGTTNHGHGHRLGLAKAQQHGRPTD